MLVNQTEYSGEKANGKIYHYIIHIYPINLLEKNKNKLRVVNILVCVCVCVFSFSFHMLSVSTDCQCNCVSIFRGKTVKIILTVLSSLGMVKMRCFSGLLFPCHSDT